MDSYYQITTSSPSTSAVKSSSPLASTSSTRPATTASSSSSSLNSAQYAVTPNQRDPSVTQQFRENSSAMEAPLCSPSLAQPSTYFGVSQTHQHNYNTRSSAVQRQTYMETLQRQAKAQDSASPFLRDFSLVAEAAKRAQMAVLMRDLEACGFEEEQR